ncbi:MAG: hypothetical protein ACOCXS_02615 [Bacteroidota bacterium]
MRISPRTKSNNVQLGIILGLAIPTLAFLLVYFIKFNAISFVEFVGLLNSKAVFTQVLSLCVLPNLLSFFIFIWTNRMLSARGVLIATFVYTMLILLLKLIF